MDIKDIKMEKAKAQAIISKAMEDFESTTGLEIYRSSFERFNNLGEPVCYICSLEVRL